MGRYHTRFIGRFSTVKRDMKWGTSNPIPLMDKSIGFPVSLRAYGKWGFKIDDPRAFLVQFVGSQEYADAQKIYEITKNLGWFYHCCESKRSYRVF